MKSLGSARTSRPVLAAVVVAGVAFGGLVYLTLGPPDGAVGPPTAGLSPAARNPGPAAARLASSFPRTPDPGMPAEAEARQNGHFMAVFLALGDGRDAGPIQAAQRRATALGYYGGVGGLGCTRGAAEALHTGAGTGLVAYSIFFDTADQAERFAAVYGAGVLGIVPIVATCID